MGEMPALYDFPVPLKSENIEYHYGRLRNAWDKVIDKIHKNESNN